MRKCYLVCYDIANPKRLQKIHRIMCSYGDPWQYSVFHCFLKDIDRVRLQKDLSNVIHNKEDQVLILDLGSTDNSDRKAVTTLGKKLPPVRSGIVVV
ncbi:MAG: CRISPR-associated endonuclease Cas2 [Candidatus Hydrogenedens sp.]|nr:CRISPR-associated endonuclease Cas2 [Candidatus Hydrogenedens sp.]